MQDEIARSIVLRLKVALGGDARLVTAPTSNMEAYELYLRGRAMSEQARSLGRPSSREFRTGTGAHWRVTRGMAGVADARAQLCFGGYVRPSDTMPAASEAASRSVMLDHCLQMAHTALAYVSQLWDRDFPRPSVIFSRPSS